jgi:kynurenine formamidase
MERITHMDNEQFFDMFSGLHVYDLEQQRYAGAPIHPSHVPGFIYTLHRHHEPGTGETRSSASGIMYAAEHSGTHIDALCHQAENLTLHGGREITPKLQTATGFTELGAETIAPIRSRGVLIDIAGYRGVDWIDGDHPITQADLEGASRQQGTAIRQGDVVLVRTGNGSRWNDAEGYLKAGGVEGAASQWLADQQVQAVGADNMAWDSLGTVDPTLHVSLPGHLILLVRHGIYIIENLFLEELARDQVYEFLFVCLPLKMRGATGSPVRPIALAPNP